MPATYPSLAYGNFPILDGQLDPQRSSQLVKYSSCLYCEEWPGLAGIIHESIPCEISHYVARNQPAPELNSLTFCTGSFKVHRDADSREITVRITTVSMWQYPGDVSRDDYTDHVPPQMHQQLEVMGVAHQHIQHATTTDTMLRGFHLNTQVYDKANLDNVMPFTVVCLFPTTRRWENTPLLNQGVQVSVLREVMGMSEEGGHVMIRIQLFNYIPPPPTTGNLASSSQGGPGSSPGTPSKKGRWAQWGAGPSGSPRSAGKRRLADQAAGPSGQGSSGAVIVASLPPDQAPFS